MKLFYHIRYLFQLLTVVSAFLVLGSLGAWETGGISLWECILQLVAFTAIGVFCARAGSKKPARRRHAPGAPDAGRAGAACPPPRRRRARGLNAYPHAARRHPASAAREKAAGIPRLSCFWRSLWIRTPCLYTPSKSKGGVYSSFAELFSCM